MQNSKKKEIPASTILSFTRAFLSWRLTDVETEPNNHAEVSHLGSQMRARHSQAWLLWRIMFPLGKNTR